MKQNVQRYQECGNARRSSERRENSLVKSHTHDTPHTVHFYPAANTGDAIGTFLKRWNQQPNLLQKNTLESGIDHQEITIHPELSSPRVYSNSRDLSSLVSLVSSVLFHFFRVMDEMEPGESRIEGSSFSCSTR